MFKKVSLFTFAVFLLALVIVGGQKRSAMAAPSAERPINQMMVKFEEGIELSTATAVSRNARLQQLSASTGVDLAYGRPMSGNADVLALSNPLSIADATQLAAQLSARPDIVYAAPDRILTIDDNPAKNGGAPVLTVPNDPQYVNQWHYKYTAGSAEGVNLEPAWDITTGSASVVVAVLDTGILNHTDLAGRTVPGYDFIADVATANDGDARDSDPSDPGDWCNANPSSWHGTHVAGTIGAASNNGTGVTGVNWVSKILPVRVLGTCGGFNSDIIDGIRWSAGLSVPGVPANANPAKVLNLSLGGSGACDAATQSAIDDAVAAGSVVIVAAGNENVDAINSSPANCNNIVTVAANGPTGNRAGYSNYGSVVEVTGPGGDQALGTSAGVLSTLDSGTTTPNNDNAYAYYQGTSMATPHVAGVASLLLSAEPSLTPAQVSQRLQVTARPFPAGSTCNTSICGTGIVDAFQALNYTPPTLNETVYLPVVVRPLPPTVSNPFSNPGFESGRTGWTEYSSNNWILIVATADFPSGATPRTGGWGAWLGGGNNESSYLQQQVTVPASAPYLTYWRWIDSAEPSCGADIARIMVNGNVVDTYNLCTGNSTGGWAAHSVNLSAYANQSVTLQIRTDNNGSNSSSLLLDDFSFEASPRPAVQPENGIEFTGSNK